MSDHTDRPGGQSPSPATGSEQLAISLLRETGLLYTDSDGTWVNGTEIVRLAEADE